jgi:hypothetical protein
LAETYAGHATTIGNQAAGTVQGAHEDTALKVAERDLKVSNTVVPTYNSI